MSARLTDLEDSFDPRERIQRGRRKPAGRRRLAELRGPEGELESTDAPLFGDPVLAQLHDLGHVTELIGELKSGKEATVYLARGPRGLAAVKLYRDLEARSFKNDAVYRAGDFIVDARIRKAIEQRSGRGLDALQGMWCAREWAMLWALYRAGLPVPEPLIGPDVTDYLAAGRAVVMRFIGDEDSAAPRLSEARLTPDEGREAWSQALDGMAALLKLGYVHGDYSTYNLLWSENRVIIIDFPQLTTKANPNFQELLRRDAASLARSFARHGIRETAESTLREVGQRAHRQPEAPRPKPTRLDVQPVGGQPVQADPPTYQPNLVTLP